jgi:glycine betaine/choline ABC-type transport system substrate-binding protein
VIDTINTLSGAIDTPTMSALNVLYDDGVEPDQIAREWLSENGYID